MVDCLIKVDITSMNLPVNSTKNASKFPSDTFENLINTIKGEIATSPNNFSELPNMIQFGKLNSNDDFVIADLVESNNTDVNLENVDFSVIAGYINQITELLQEKFSLTEAELNQLMDDAGISKTDLLTNSGLTNLLTKLSPEENILTLLTDSDGSKMVKELLTFVNNVKEILDPKFKLNEQDFTKLLQELAEESGSQQNLGSEQADIQDLPNQLSSPANILEETDVKVTNISTNNSSNTSVQVTEDTPIVEPIVQEGSNLESSLSNEDSSLNNFTQVFSDKLSEIFEDSNETIDVQKLVKQVIDEIKVTIRQDLSKMEMQLYPEHLGKIGLEIVSKEGSVSAHIVASSAAVKEALEANISMLKTNMENQGIKVDSIEVTVASHELEQQFNQNNEKDDRQSGKRKRFMNIEALETISEMNTMDEQLEEQRKKMDGHSVSFKA